MYCILALVSNIVILASVSKCVPEVRFVNMLKMNPSACFWMPSSLLILSTVWANHTELVHSSIGLISVLYAIFVSGSANFGVRPKHKKFTSGLVYNSINALISNQFFIKRNAKGIYSGLQIVHFFCSQCN